MNPQEVLGMLRRLPIFASLTNDEALAVAEQCRLAVWRPGGVLFREGDHGDTLMIVLKGEIQVSCRSDDGVMVQVALLREGDVIGEMAVLDPAPRAATAMALTHTIVLMIDARTLDQLIDINQPAASQIMRTILALLSKRLRLMDERIEQVFSARLKDAEIRDATEPDHARRIP